MKGTKSKFNIGKLFYNDKFVMLFSAILAFIIWVNVSLTSQETRYLTVTDIPITLPELGNELKIFGSEEQNAEVRISGNSLLVASVTSSDIVITAADTSQLSSPGKYQLALVPKKGSVKNDYNFESTVRPSKIEVYVDRYAEKEIPITDKIDVSAVDKEHYAATTKLSRQTVTVKGAETVINSIVSADAEYSFTGSISTTQNVEASIILKDSNDEQVDMTYISMDEPTVSATVPILEIKTVKIVPSFTNAPESFEYDSSMISIEPSEIQIAVPDDVTDNITPIRTEDIDLSQIDMNNNRANVNLLIPAGTRNLSQMTMASVSFDKNEMTTKQIILKDFTIINESENRKTKVTTKSLAVKVVGSKDQINNLNASNLTAVVDMSSKVSFSGLGSMPVSISINGRFPQCWSYGTYEVDVNVTDTSQNNSNSSG